MRKGQKNMFEEIMAEIFTEIMKEMNHRLKRLGEY